MPSTVEAQEITTTDPEYVAGTANVEETFYSIQLQLEYIAANLATIDLTAELAVLAGLWMLLVDDDILPAVERKYAKSVLYAHDALQSLLNKTADDLGIPPTVAPAVDMRISQGMHDSVRTQLTGIADRMTDSLHTIMSDTTLSVGERLDATRQDLREREHSARIDIHDVLLRTAERATYQQVSAGGVVFEKEWITQEDNRVRPAHRETAHTRVITDGHFVVDGYAMDGPHDPTAPLYLIANCRCHLRYWFTEESLRARLTEQTLTASADKKTGAMVALIPSEADLARIVLSDGEPVEELHLTLLFLGDAVDLPEDALSAVSDELRNIPELHEVHARGFGIGFWNPSSDTPAWVMQIGEIKEDSSPTFSRLADLQDAASYAVVKSTLDTGYLLPVQHAPWSPHICLKYAGTEAQDELTAMTERLGDIVFDRLRVAVGTEQTDIILK